MFPDQRTSDLPGFEVDVAGRYDNRRGSDLFGDLRHERHIPS